MDQMIIKKIEDSFPIFQGRIKKIRFSTGNFSSEEFNSAQKEKLNQDQKNLNKKNIQHPFNPKFRQKKAHAQSLFADIEDEEIKLGFNNELSPALINTENTPEFLGIIMPLKL